MITAMKCSISHCGNDVKARGYCDKHWQQWQKKGQIVERLCLTCGGVINRGKGHYNYCSDECRPGCAVKGCLDPVESKGLCHIHSANNRRNGSPCRLCQTCGKPIVNRGGGSHTYCSDECIPACSVDSCDDPCRGGSDLCASHRVQLQRDGELRPFGYKWSAIGSLCAWCGGPVPKDIGMRKFCSGACKTKIRKHRLRAARASQPFENIDVGAVYERDEWCCQLCHLPVDESLRYPDQLCATLDHIVPLSRGGSHTYSNVQLAHAFCNITKGAGIVDDSSVLSKRLVLKMILGESKSLVAVGV
jgi:predicted nucleic acid-binding Zn ribbon protein